MHSNDKLRFSYTINAMQVNNEVLFGADIAGVVSVDFSNTSKAVVDALACLDGSKSMSEVSSLQNLTESEETELYEVVKTLLEHKIIEKTEAKSDAIKSLKHKETDYERFDRQINLFKHHVGSFEDAIKIQNSLTSSRVSIIGLGGCGSYIFYTLAAMGVGSLKSIEFDKVELSNLSRQILYNHEDVGKRKIDVASKKGPLISPSTKFEFIDKKVLNVKDAAVVFDNVDLVICAADNPRPEFYEIMNEAAYFYGVPMLYAASATSNVVIGPLVIPGKSRCYKCINYTEEPKRQHDFVNMVQDGYMTTLIDPYNATAGALGALEAVKFLTGFQETRVIERTMFVDLGNYSITTEADVRSGACEVCRP